MATHACALQEDDDTLCYYDGGAIVTLRVVSRQGVPDFVMTLAQAIGRVIDALDEGSPENASSALGALFDRLVGVTPSERVAAVRLVRMGYGLAKASAEDAPAKE